MTSLPASDPGSAAVWGSKRINSRPQFCLCLAWSGCPSNDDDDEFSTYPLRVTLTHQSLSFFERALRLPPTFPIASLANSNPRTRLKKSSWRSFSRSHNLTPNLHLTHEPLILCPLKPPWSAPSNYAISLHLSSPSSRKDPPFLCNTAATSHLSTLSHSDISAWTDCSVPGGLGQGGAGIHIKCTKCVTTSLSFSTVIWATSYSAETFALLHALEWCISHSKTCNFESITFFSDSLSVLSTLSTSLPYLTPNPDPILNLLTLYLNPSLSIYNGYLVTLPSQVTT